MVQRILKRASESADKREDDNEETIKNRIATFIKNTDEILVQYPAQTKRVSCWSFLCAFKWLDLTDSIFQINGERPVDEIFVDVSNEIDSILAKKSTAAAAAAASNWTLLALRKMAVKSTNQKSNRIHQLIVFNLQWARVILQN